MAKQIQAKQDEAFVRKQFKSNYQNSPIKNNFQKNDEYPEYKRILEESKLTAERERKAREKEKAELEKKKAEQIQIEQALQ